MAKVSLGDLREYVESQGGELVRLSNGNYNIRKGMKSANIGRPDGGNRWDTAQLLRAWGDATDIPRPDWG
jgi:hypothetical protein